MTDATVASSAAALPTRLTARALLLGERLDTSGLERSDMIAAAPLAFRVGSIGFAALFRFGVAVLVGLSPVEEDDFLAKIKLRISGERDRIDDEAAVIEISPDHEDHVPPGGPFLLKDLSPQRFLVVADALAKSVSLARDEREVSAVFDVIEPFAAQLAKAGRPPGNRRSMLRLIGQALLVQHRMSGRIAIEEKPDILWDRPDLERLYARLEDEYELKERAGTLKRKLDVVVETARALTDIIDADRATRLEATIIILIVAEILIALAQSLLWRSGH
ncbi:MAG: RMD1 family protein [Methylobacteriaceae bacterium]|nr:RMD1 family protein [Methylobacteriaceae bacterium]MBV9245304.1 RMD1 family protein [Methylobacteriaceae bacterium]